MRVVVDYVLAIVVVDVFNGCFGGGRTEAWGNRDDWVVVVDGGVDVIDVKIVDIVNIVYSGYRVNNSSAEQCLSSGVTGCGDKVGAGAAV